MRKTIISNRENPKMRNNKGYLGILGTAITIALLAVFISGCTKEGPVKEPTGSNPLTSDIIAGTTPANQADTVVINPVVAVTFNSSVTPSEVSASTIVLKEGTVTVPGTVSYSGTTVAFTPSTDLKPNTEYSATIKTSVKGSSENEHSWRFKTGRDRKNNKMSILSVAPVNQATDVPLDVQPSVTFKNGTPLSIIQAMTFTLKQGTTTVDGTINYSGTTATFVPAASLTANTVYTATISSAVNNGGGGDGEDENESDNEHEGSYNHQSSNQSSNSYSWSFTTGGEGGGVDVTPPTVLSVVPANNSTSASLNAVPTVTFSEAINPSTVNSTTFTLKQGTTVVAGTVTYSGTTAKFTPASDLMANTVYLATVTTGVQDLAGNALTSDYTWSFTTASDVDVTPPTVISMVPANNATSVAVNSTVTATFSEAMNSSTITSSTFTLKQGTTSVAGTVTYSGTTATFTPSAALAGGMVYTATITTGAQDLAGNPIATAKTWSFTTVATTTTVSFATQVLPILQNKCMPCHGATNPTAGISITNYTTVSKLSNSQIDNPGMYPKMGVTAAEQALIKAWIAAGRPNN